MRGQVVTTDLLVLVGGSSAGKVSLPSRATEPTVSATLAVSLVEGRACNFVLQRVPAWAAYWAPHVGPEASRRLGGEELAGPGRSACGGRRSGWCRVRPSVGVARRVVVGGGWASARGALAAGRSGRCCVRGVLRVLRLCCGAAFSWCGLKGGGWRRRTGSARVHWVAGHRAGAACGVRLVWPVGVGVSRVLRGG